jgi:uncharacterized RDD family membrane protein YckC
MTQQGDTTSQQPGPEQPAAQPAPAPFWPSPYLAEGQSAPEAYPAPAQPGQPRYGTTAPAPGARQAGYAPPGYAPPGYAPPGYGQPGRGQPGSRPGFRRPGQAQAGGPRQASGPGPGGSTSRQRDPVIASGWERLLAMTIDWMLILIVSFALLHEQMIQFWHRLESTVNAMQGLSQSAEQATFSNFEHSAATASAKFSYFLMAFLLALVYFWTAEALGGATLGKRLLGLRVVRAADLSPAGVVPAGIRTVLFLAGPAVFTFVPDGFQAAGLIVIVGALIWLADGLVLATDARRQSLHDRAAGTLVVRAAALKRQQAQPGSPW